MNMMGEAIVISPNTVKACSTPWINAVGLDRRLSGTNIAAINDAAATPKLIDICWPVLAMVLAALVCWVVTSAYTSGFMLVYCVDVKKPRMNARKAMGQAGGPT